MTNAGHSLARNRPGQRGSKACLTADHDPFAIILLRARSIRLRKCLYSRHWALTIAHWSPPGANAAVEVAAAT